MRHIMKYQPEQRMLDRLVNDYTYHAPIQDQIERMQRIRAAAHDLAILTLMNTPPSREQSVALTQLETFVMHANAAIVRNEGR